MNNVLDFIRAAAPWVAVGLAVAIIAVRSAPTGTVRIWEYSEICRVRIPSVSFADSFPCAQGEPFVFVRISGYLVRIVPALLPVKLPFRTAGRPETKTVSIPAENWAGSG